MGKSKRKNKKKNRRTRKQRGGIQPKQTNVEYFNKMTGQKVPTENQICVESLKKGSKYNMNIPIWTDRLRRRLPRNQQRKWQKAIEDTRWDERQKWCKKSKGYCKAGKAWIKADTTKTKKRCIPGTLNSGNFCQVDLNLLEWHHCVQKCGRSSKLDSDKLKDIKKNEAKIKCNEVRVKIGEKLFKMQDAAQGLIDHNAELKEKLEAKKAKELAEKKKREAKARKEAEAAIARAKKLMEEKKAQEAERKRKLKKAEEKRKEKVRLEAERKRKEKEKHDREVAEAKAKQEKERLEKLRKEKADREEKERIRKEKEEKEKADKAQKLKEKREKEAQDKAKCQANMLKDFNDESEKIIENALNGKKNIGEWVDDSEDIEEAFKRLGKINDIQRKIAEKYNNCYKKINPNLPGGPRNELKAKLIKIQKKFMPYYEQIENVQERIDREEAEEYKVQSPQNLKYGAQTSIAYLNKNTPKKCKEKRACNNELQRKIQNKKGLQQKPKFCIGSVIEGQDLYGSSMSLDYYTGVVIGNAIEKGLPSKYQPGYPAVYYSNYNYGSFPFYSILVKVNKPSKSKIDNFKKWYYKMARRHNDKPGEYPIGTLKAMIDGKLTLKGKKTTKYKNQPQSIPIHLIKYLPCIPKGHSGGGRKRHTRKKRGGYISKAGETQCIWYGKEDKTNQKKSNCAPDDLQQETPDAEMAQIYPLGIKKCGWMDCGMVGYKQDIAVDYPLKEVTSWYPKVMNSMTKIDNKTEPGTYDLYYIIHEANSGSSDSQGNKERYELLKQKKVIIIKSTKKGYDLTIINKPVWNDPMHLKFEDDENMTIMWGTKEIKGKIGNLWRNKKRRATVGGRKRLTRRKRIQRRKHTKKRR